MLRTVNLSEEARITHEEMRLLYKKEGVLAMIISSNKQIIGPVYANLAQGPVSHT